MKPEKLKDIETNSLLEIDAVAKLLQMKVSRIRYEVFMGTIPHFKIGRSIRFSKEQIEHWLATKVKEVKNG